jgi:hypothetical protein
VLMGWIRLTGGSDVSLAYPALIAGVVGPTLLYLTPRLLGYARWIGVLLGAALAASQADIIYSGRLKPDTTDILVVLVLVVLVQRPRPNQVALADCNPVGLGSHSAIYPQPLLIRRCGSRGIGASCSSGIRSRDSWSRYWATGGGHPPPRSCNCH